MGSSPPRRVIAFLRRNGLVPTWVVARWPLVEFLRRLGSCQVSGTGRGDPGTDGGSVDSTLAVPSPELGLVCATSVERIMDPANAVLLDAQNEPRADCFNNRSDP